MMTTADLHHICSKTKKLWIHSGALHYHDPDAVLLPQDVAVLKAGSRDIINELINSQSSSISSPHPSLLAVPDVGPLTFQQEFALDYLGAGFCASYLAQLTGELNVDLLSKCFGIALRRHGALRTKIVVENRVLMQQVMEPRGPALEVQDLSTSAGTISEDEVHRNIWSSFRQWLDVGDSAFEAKLVRISAQHHILHIAWDHLLFDYVSSLLVFREIWSLYQDFKGAQSRLLSSTPMQYLDYAAWQRQAYGEWLDKHSAYWEQRLGGQEPIRPPTEGNVLGEQTFSYIDLAFGAKLSLELDQLSRKAKVALPLLALSLAAIALSRWSDQRKFVFPFTFSGRHRVEHADVVGYLPNLLPLRFDLAVDQAFPDVLRSVSREFFSAVYNVEVGKSLDGSNPDLFRELYVQWFSAPPAEAILPDPHHWDARKLGLTVQRFSLVVPPSSEEKSSVQRAYKMWLEFNNTTAGITALLCYRSELFSTATMLKLLQDIKAVGEYFVCEPSNKLSSLPS